MGMMCLWFKDGSDAWLDDREEDGHPRLRTEVDHRGNLFMKFPEEPCDPTAPDLNIFNPIIAGVTYRGVISQGLRHDGIYRLDGAVLMVHSTSSGFQDIRVKAQSLEKLRTIYTLVRQGKLKPEEDWSKSHWEGSLTPTPTTSGEATDEARSNT